VQRRLAIFSHAEEVTGNVAMTCRYYGITRQTFYTWRRRFEELGDQGLVRGPIDSLQEALETASKYTWEATSPRSTAP